jgi:hypothetical protein
MYMLEYVVFLLPSWRYQPPAQQQEMLLYREHFQLPGVWSLWGAAINKVSIELKIFKRKS